MVGTESSGFAPSGTRLATGRGSLDGTAGALLVLVVLAAGCLPEPGDDGVTLADCSPSCRQGYVCQQGQCVPDSGGSGCQPACRVGFACQGGQCVPDNNGNSSNSDIGAACAKASECSTSRCLSGQGIPGGYCSKTCGARVSNGGSDCPDGSFCLPVSNSASYCLDGCSSSADCRRDYKCVQTQGTSVCLPRCQSNADCGSGQYCDTDSGQCRRRTQQTNDGQLGSACGSDAQCDKTSCLTEQATNGVFPSGYCAAGCSQSQAGAGCQGADGLCVGLPADMGKNYVCLQNCSTGNDCRDGYICTADTGTTNSQGLGFCWPHCRHYKCASGSSCNAATGICEDTGTGGGGNQAVVHRNVWNGSLSRNQARKISVQVPDDAYAYSLVATPSHSGTSPVLLRVDGPGGTTLFDAQSPFNSKLDLAPIKNTSGGGTITLQLPNAPNYTVRGGSYTVWLAATEQTDARVDLLVKTGAVRAQQNQLPLTFWVLPQNHLSAAEAPNHPKFQQALSTFEAIYKRMGIQIGPVRYREVTGSRARDLAVVDDGQFTRLWSLIDRNRAEGLNFVVVDHFSGSGGGGQTLGRSGGIPGPPTHDASPAGGVAVAAATLPSEDGRFFGAVMAHEAGHYLGLRHTTEQPGTVFDPLGDTPKCSARHDANGNGVVEPGECLGRGTQNLMFWAANDRTPKQVTDAQSFVIQHNPSLE